MPVQFTEISETAPAACVETGILDSGAQSTCPGRRRPLRPHGPVYGRSDGPGPGRLTRLCGLTGPRARPRAGSCGPTPTSASSDRDQDSERMDDTFIQGRCRALLDLCKEAILETKKDVLHVETQKVTSNAEFSTKSTVADCIVSRL